MMAKVTVETKPWEIPEFIVIVGEGKELSIAVDAVSMDELTAQADQWLIHLFASVEQPNPFVLNGKVI